MTGGLCARSDRLHSYLVTTREKNWSFVRSRLCCKYRHERERMWEVGEKEREREIERDQEREWDGEREKNDK